MVMKTQTNLVFSPLHRICLRDPVWVIGRHDCCNTRQFCVAGERGIATSWRWVNNVFDVGWLTNRAARALALNVGSHDQGHLRSTTLETRAAR